ncbi:minor capsid protein [Stenotrophomonas phage Sonora]|nr:minor capsid protein [Stenotrophomonas phage Sonora]
MPTANEELLDATLRHQISLRRYSAGLIKRISALLERADADLTIKLRARLAEFEGKPIDFTSARWKELLDEMKSLRAATMVQYRDLARGELAALPAIEASKELAILTASIPIEYAWATVAPDQLRAISSSRPFQGKLLKDWFGDLERADQQRLTAAIQLGMAQGEPVDDIVRRVVGTKAAGYSDGVLAISRRDASSIVRTAVNHVSNTAREYVWDANEDVIQCKVWSSTLDGRTSASCRARDGHGIRVGNNPLPEGMKPVTPAGARPPGHINCRSTLIAYLRGIGLLGNRPYVTDTRTRDKREIDFRKEAKKSGSTVPEVRRAWAEQNIGRVPATTTYQDFLKRQPASFQDKVLGPTRGKLFRSGGLNVDQFVDRAGNEMTLAQLAASKPEAFIKAGLSPTAP